MTEAPARGGTDKPIETAVTAVSNFLGAQKLEDGIGLCLSGGGFRAVLFHLGALIRLNELGLLPQINRVASVSGGSIAAGALAVGWHNLAFGPNGVAANLVEVVAQPLLKLTRMHIDIPAIALGFVPFVHSSRIAAWAYDRVLFQGKTLQDLPTSPRFSFTATSLQSGTLWRFSRDYAADWRVGRWDKPELSLALVVSASASFPPYLSPAYINVPPGAIVAQPGADLFGEAYTRQLCLTDGGIYDNLGLEPVWKRYRTILVSDGGAMMPPAPTPRTGWLSQAMRSMNIGLQQGINMRRRVLLGLQLTGEREVAYWGIAEPVESYGRTNRLRFSAADTRRAATVPTRLTKYPAEIRGLILRAGYAHADASLQASKISLSVIREPSFETAFQFTSTD
jgi:NTE family protein